ncbi:hypothetical protein CLV90_3191 [Maribacter spongiicola]|uniref:Histidine kinase/DNA gyrase B/HSP90-like ATPase n=1 Tax=Maribacter spongiicola TaxID=1206753 RepID=A0A4R7JY03_9FLAO|nr:ATP-binding protein [Maribacter spongiicola]TDT41959.1 hypothetical protein CLV90_3191 [Maribacter spongiicola]
MKTLRINVPVNNTKVKWFDFANKVLNYDFSSYEKIIIDFKKITFLDTYQIVLLACTIELIGQKNNVLIEFEGGGKSLNKHLDNIKFKNYWCKGFNRDNYTQANNSTTLCLWHISKPMIEGYGMQAQLYFKRAFFTNKDLQPFSSSLVEIFNNVFDHAESPINGYVLTQYFPQMNKMTFVVVDLGIGIPSTVNNYLIKNNKPVLTDSNCIIKSLEYGMTVGSQPRNAGLGLSLVHDFAESSGGKFSIFSKSGYYIKKSGVEPIYGETKNQFDGTFIEVEIDTNTFDDFDPEDAVYDFF